MNKYKFINTWYDLGALITVPPHYISWLKLDDNKASRQDRKAIKQKNKVRITYQSSGALAIIQRALEDEFAEMFKLRDTDGIIAYVPGCNPGAYVKDNLIGHDVIIKFDIRGYYDSITYTHIADTMREYGMPGSGANLVAFLTTVKRTKGSTLQQGSSCSPMLSNLVGQKYIDRPIKSWLQHNVPDTVQYKYTRYSDNILLGLTGAIPEDFNERYKAFVKTLTYKVHKYEYVTKDNPVKHQKFLGVVLNKRARVVKQYSDRVICTLFNLCVRDNVKDEIDKYKMYNPKINTVTNDFYTGTTYGLDSIMQQLNGRVAYLKNVDDRAYLQAKKLLWCVNNPTKLPVKVVKRYRNILETYEHFIENAQYYLNTQCSAEG